MPELLLLNPRRRRKTARRNPVAAKVRRRSNPRRRVARRRNPINRWKILGAPMSNPRRRRRRHNPIGLRRAHHTSRRRRRNPIGLPGMSARGMLGQFKDAFVGGAGSLIVDMVMGRINPYLPASLQTTDKVGIGDAVKAVMTVLLGNALSRPTSGLSRRMAAGALVCQARDILSSLVPSTLTLGYASPARVINASARVGPVRSMAHGNMVAAYTRPGVTPLLNAYMRPGATALLSGGRGRARVREGVQYR